MRGSGRTHKQVLIGLQEAWENGCTVIFLVHHQAMRTHAMDMAASVIFTQGKTFVAGQAAGATLSFPGRPGKFQVATIEENPEIHLGKNKLRIIVDHAVRERIIPGSKHWDDWWRWGLFLETRFPHIDSNGVYHDGKS